VGDVRGANVKVANGRGHRVRARQIRSTNCRNKHVLFLVVPQLPTQLLELVTQVLHARILVVGRHRARDDVESRGCD
jgi:hypothetical protein